jgi:RNA polymerase sigma-70 factor, ECF subfamily
MQVESAYAGHRGYLMTVASRILANRAEAEDVVHDAFTRLAVQPPGQVQDERGWLVVVVRRLSLDRLGSAHLRLSSPVADPVLTETAPDPADRMTLDDEVRRALGVLIDRLTPAERTSFLLHDVFGFPFDAVAEVVGRSPAACRTLASRARHALRHAGDVPAPVTDAVTAEVTRRFLHACQGGDLSALLALLDPEVDGDATIDGVRHGFARGANDVGARVLSFLGPHVVQTLEVVPLEDAMAVIASRAGRPAALVRIEVENGRIRHLHAFVLPA